jgi:alpha-tubulin suppressor-like RCC1 family protein
VLATKGTEVWAWGGNSNGQLGDGTTEHRTAPVQVCAPGATAPCSTANGNAFTSINQVATGNWFSVAMTGMQQVWTWGGDGSGTLGNGSGSSSSEVPVRVCAPGDIVCSAYLPPVAGVAAGSTHALAVNALPPYEVWAWGRNDRGQLGVEGVDERGSPTPVCEVPGSAGACVTPLTNVARIAAGRDFSLAVKYDGTLWAWGVNRFGQLGVPGGDSNVPVAVAPF